ncbi:hypothetical protein MBANPS3_008491 [Mucor bainieri]
MSKRKAADDARPDIIATYKGNKRATTAHGYSFVNTAKVYSIAYLKDSPVEDDNDSSGYESSSDDNTSTDDESSSDYESSGGSAGISDATTSTDDESSSVPVGSSNDDTSTNYERSEDGGSAGLSRGRTSNHVPLSIYENIQSKPISQAFAGFFAADGVNAHRRAVTGIGLRSTDFPFLYSLLKECGVEEPKLKFTTSNSRPNKTYKAAKLGTVYWSIGNKALLDKRAKLGLPSSKINNTKIDKARAFLFSLDFLSLVRFLLFYIAGDGGVHFGVAAGNNLWYRALYLSARDDLG